MMLEDLYMTLILLNIPEELICIIMSHICICNMKNYIQHYGNDFLTFCQKLKNSKGIVIGNFLLGCMIGKYSMTDSEKPKPKMLNRSLLIPIEILVNVSPDASFFHNAGNDTKIEWYLQRNASSFSNNKKYKYRRMNEVEYAHEIIMTNKENNYASRYHITTIYSDSQSDETCPILQKLTSGYRGHVKNIYDFVRLTSDFPMLNITFDGNTIDVANWHSIIFKEIQRKQMNLYLSSSNSWLSYAREHNDPVALRRLYSLYSNQIRNTINLLYATPTERLSMSVCDVVKSLSQNQNQIEISEIDCIRRQIIEYAMNRIYHDWSMYSSDGFKIV